MFLKYIEMVSQCLTHEQDNTLEKLGACVLPNLRGRCVVIQIKSEKERKGSLSLAGWTPRLCFVSRKDRFTWFFFLSLPHTRFFSFFLTSQAFSMHSRPSLIPSFFDDRFSYSRHKKINYPRTIEISHFFIERQVRT